MKLIKTLAVSALAVTSVVVSAGISSAEMVNTTSVTTSTTSTTTRAMNNSNVSAWRNNVKYNALLLSKNIQALTIPTAPVSVRGHAAIANLNVDDDSLLTESEFAPDVMCGDAK